MSQIAQRRFDFDPGKHEERIVPLLAELRDGYLAEEDFDADDYGRLVRKFPKLGGGAYSKSEVIRALRHYAPQLGWEETRELVARVRMKPIRTASGVAPVTVLTKPFPCPGKCIFCPSDVRMPKSYLAREPGAQRAAQFRFDPYGQTLGRLLTYHRNGHLFDKVELIVLGGTWSFYPEEYQIWFVLRCFEAMNDFSAGVAEDLPEVVGELGFEPRPGELEEVDGLGGTPTYNQAIASYLQKRLGGLVDRRETAAWEQLESAHERNETAEARCVGLVLETRPDHLDDDEVVRLRRLGCTKVQIGIQSLDDVVLEANRRGHDVNATRRAMAKLRAAGFKLHGHWMPNLLGSSPESDRVDYLRLWNDPAIRPDELKIYPCSLIETAELMKWYRSGDWRPYGTDELADLLADCLAATPSYCRLTRIIRDIPGDEIVDGNQVTNLREVVERRMSRQGKASRDIRAREVRQSQVDLETLRLETTEYETSIGREVFFEFVARDADRSGERLLGFCRLSLPDTAGPDEVRIPEIRNSAMIREVHVYGVVVGLGEAGDESRSQHLGLGSRLVAVAMDRARAEGFDDLAVISAVGTRDYYRGLGFEDGALYLHVQLT
ncbi:MAG: tRNA uridine(34) 5-carboxymethylaminomethyl modification radical SAM/GNAT enzyme Elp3 [Thermoanaerobaculia bacterium]|nr:tRNA uridine(34) 5-carboxymethylaminomethyl modification radical SAM/GNAT enzyme Elp3 [Thermoanaerobaculia bacterium]